jgi:hypothetical protein
MKKFTSLALLGAVASMCLYTTGLSAWERTAMKDCKEDNDVCKKDVDKCKKDGSSNCQKVETKCKDKLEKCKKDADKKDQGSFAASLSAFSKTQFQNFSEDQKKKAMDMADDNEMNPDDAVAKVAGKNGKSKY